ncbi:hypothetical protein [Haloarchaeobius sp. DFWS5]
MSTDDRHSRVREWAELLGETVPASATNRMWAARPSGDREN